MFGAWKSLPDCSNQLPNGKWPENESLPNKFTKDGFDKGIRYLNQAIALDPNYALAYSALAYNYINQDDWFMAPKEAGPKPEKRPRRH